MLYIIYFNLKNGVSEEEFVNNSKELPGYLARRRAPQKRVQ